MVPATTGPGAAGMSMPAAFWSTALRRRLGLLVTLTVVCGLAGVGFAFLRGAHYTASASILLDPLDGNPYSPDNRGDQLVNLQTEAALVATDPVAGIARQRMHSTEPEEELRSRVEVEVPTNTQVLQISYASGDRTEARAGAQAFAEAYLTFRGQQAREVVNAEIDRVRQQETTTKSSIDQASAESKSSTVTASRKTYLQDKIATLSSRLAGLESQQSSLQATDLHPGQLITQASLPPAASPTGLALYGGAGALGGLMVAMLIAVTRARADDRLHEAYDVEALDVPALGVASERFGAGVRRPGGGWSGPGAGSGTGSGSGAASSSSNAGSGDEAETVMPELPEAYRELRTSLITWAGEPPVCLGFLSASPSVSAAPETAGLALALARAGFRVAVVDTLGETAGLLGGRGRLRGLGELLVEGEELDRLLIRPEERLTVLPIGRAHAYTMDRLLSPRMRQTMAELVARHDYVLVAGGAAVGADGRAVASLTRAAVLVAHRHVTTRDRLTESGAAVGRVDAELLGAILVDAGAAAGAVRRAGHFLAGPFGRRSRRGRDGTSAVGTVGTGSVGTVGAGVGAAGAGSVGAGAVGAGGAGAEHAVAQANPGASPVGPAGAGAAGGSSAAVGQNGARAGAPSASGQGAGRAGWAETYDDNAANPPERTNPLIGPDGRAAPDLPLAVRLGSLTENSRPDDPGSSRP